MVPWFKLIHLGQLICPITRELIFFKTDSMTRVSSISKKASLFFFLPTANAFAVVQFSNPSTKFFLLHFHFLSDLVSSVRYQHYFCSNYPYHTVSIYSIGNCREKKIKSFARKKIKKIIFQIYIYIFFTHQILSYSVTILTFTFRHLHFENIGISTYTII